MIARRSRRRSRPLPDRRRGASTRRRAIDDFPHRHGGRRAAARLSGRRGCSIATALPAGAAISPERSRDRAAPALLVGTRLTRISRDNLQGRWRAWECLIGLPDVSRRLAAARRAPSAHAEAAAAADHASGRRHGTAGGSAIDRIAPAQRRGRSRPREGRRPPYRRWQPPCIGTAATTIAVLASSAWPRYWFTVAPRRHRYGRHHRALPRHWWSR